MAGGLKNYYRSTIQDMKAVVVVNLDEVDCESFGLDMDRTNDRFNGGDTKLCVETEIMGIGNEIIWREGETYHVVVRTRIYSLTS
jgi:hypothetical protein